LNASEEADLIGSDAHPGEEPGPAAPQAQRRGRALALEHDNGQQYHAADQQSDSADT